MKKRAIEELMSGGGSRSNSYDSWISDGEEMVPPR